MPQFHNPTERSLKFDIGTRHYHVPKGGNVEIPEQFEYVVKTRNMVLRRGPHPDAKAPSAVVREALPAEVEQNLARIEPRMADSFRERWGRAGGRERTMMAAQLTKVAERRAEIELGGEPEDDEAPEVAEREPASPPDDEAAVDAGLAEAARATGRAPRRARGEG